MAKQRYNIGLLVANLTDIFSSNVTQGAIRAAKELDVNLTVFPGKYVGIQDHYDRYDTAYEYQYNVLFDLAAKAGLDYLIVATGTIAYAYDARKKKEFLHSLDSTPILSLAAKVDGYDYLLFDNRQGISQAVDALAAAGRKHICIMAGNLSNYECAERYEAYLEALRRNNLEFWPEYMTPCDITGECFNEAERLIDRNPGVDAVVCINDIVAGVVYDVIKSRGMQVGVDVAVTGFDDSPAAAIMDPPLSSVNVSAHDMGYLAVKKALGSLSGSPDNETLIPAQFIARASSSGDNPSQAADAEIERADRAGLAASYEEQKHKENVFIRDTLMFGGDLKYSYARIMKQLSLIGAQTSFIYTFKEPITHNYRDEFPSAPEWIFRSYSFGRASQVVPVEDQLMNTAQVFNNKYLCTNRQHVFIAADLFTAEIQYGIALLEPSDIGFFDELELVSYQLSSAVRTLDMLGSQARLVEELHAKNLVLEDMTKYDELTSIFNRRGFYLAAEALISENASASGRYIVCYADMNNLRQINDEYGQNEGDSAILAAADCLKTVFEADALLARVGSAEFAAIAVKTEENSAGYYADRLEKYLSAYNSSGIKTYALDLVMGITEYTCRNSYDLKSAIDKADGLLYIEKEIRKRKL